MSWASGPLGGLLLLKPYARQSGSQEQHRCGASKLKRGGCATATIEVSCLGWDGDRKCFAEKDGLEKLPLSDLFEASSRLSGGSLDQGQGDHLLGFRA